ncbi:hypothetical protein [Pseudomonas jilinensis]|uniref:Uncharacterized protein n=1 Tax=Pseudomonas jilinensis TaxID=2078689 RepID=A0A396S7Y9_9PSED|nr:hypothetical protein [Pseudomonas jilinensis]RHW19525.1 hypothetical protein C2846_18360 [Pseudomonas jilinensis]
MIELKDQAIEQGVRKRAEYDSAQRARLALNIERTDGGVLHILVEKDMRSHEEEPEIQQNTFLAVLPMVRLPGHDEYNKPPRGALPRAGRIYIFCQGKLWRELVCDGKGNLADVDIVYWRKQAEQEQQADEREPVGKPLAVTLLPIMLQGRFVADQYCMAYSEMAWTWEYITWLEASESRVQARCQGITPAWSAAVLGGEHWQATQAMPAVLIDKHVEGLRARDFNVESTLVDPAAFVPSFTAFSGNELVVKLQRIQEKLASIQQGEQPAALPELATDVDVLEDKKLRGYPRLVGLMLDDPLFVLRHATAQARQCEAYLLCLNALVAQGDNGNYAQVVYSTVMRPGDNPLAKFRHLIDRPHLLEAVFEDERKATRDYLEQILRRILVLFEQDLDIIAADWLYSRDERLLEPYAWLTEALDALNKLPSQCDALCHSQTDTSLEPRINRLATALLGANHRFTRHILAGADGQLPESAKRLLTLLASESEPDPARMGLSSLLQAANIERAPADQLFIYKNKAALVSDLMDVFATAVGTQLNRMAGSLVNIELPRLFAPSFGVLEKLSSSWQGLQLMPRGEAAARGWVILGVEGAGLRYGLSAEERRTLTRQSYRYATLHDRSGTSIGSTSPRHANRELPNLGKITVVAAPADHPQVQKLSAWKLEANRAIQGMLETPTLPLVAVVCALFNLQANIVGMRGLNQEGLEGGIRFQLGKASAVADLAVALGNLTRPILGMDNRLVTLLNKPRFDVSRISSSWAAKLYEQTGSTKLPILRTLSAVAMAATSVLAVWDAKRSWHQGDHDAALAYGVAATGAAAWTAYALGMAINPFVLVAGGVLFIGGSLLANWLIDSDAEAILKNGPFGREHGQVGALDRLLGDDKRFAHLQDPQTAYTQLLGILGRPVIRVERMATWLHQATSAQRILIQAIDAERSPSVSPPLSCVPPTPQLPRFDADDWVVSIHSPLLSMFAGEHEFQLYAEEQLGALPRQGLASAEQTTRKAVNDAKLSGLALDQGTVLYVLPNQFRQVHLTPVQRHHYTFTHRLKVTAQFHLLQADNKAHVLVLPQPSPKRWQAYDPSFKRRPAATTRPDDAPYWQIETSEFKV